MNNQLKLDKLIGQHGQVIIRNLAKECNTTEEGVYYLCSLTQDLLKMLYSIINSGMSPQETKAVFKVAIDTVILEHGMSVQIHEFNQ